VAKTLNEEIMKPIYIFQKMTLLVGICLIMVLTACEKEIKITGVASPIISLNDLRALFKGSAITLSESNMQGATSITGVVISDPANKNEPDGLVILQSFKRKILRGIALELGADSKNFQMGDSVIVNVSGKILDKKDGLTQILGLKASDITKVSTKNAQKINFSATTFSDLFNNKEEFESTLVSVKSAIAPDGRFSGTVNLSDWSNELRLITRPEASFASLTVPSYADYTGILLNDNQEHPYLMLRSKSDYAAQDLEPYRPKELYANFPEGWEKVVGTRKTSFTSAYEKYLSGEWYLENSRSLTSSGFLNISGSYGMMSQGAKESSVTMNFNLPFGASRLTFIYGAATATDNVFPIVLHAEYSQDSGKTWTQIGGDLIISELNNKYIFDQQLNLKGGIRFRIRKDNSEKRITIDDIAVYQN